jgi:hypothetical protein
MLYVPREARNDIHELAKHLPTTEEFGWTMGGFFALSTSSGVVAGVAASGAVGYVITNAMAEALALNFEALSAIPGGATQFVLAAARSSTLGLSVLASSMMGSTGQNAMNHIQNVTRILTRVISNPSSQRLTGTVIPKTFEFIGQANRVIRVTETAARQLGAPLDKLVSQVTPQALEATSKVYLYDFWKNLSSAQIQEGINQIGSWMVQATVAGSVITIGVVQSGDSSSQRDPSKQSPCTKEERQRRQEHKKQKCGYLTDYTIKSKTGTTSAYFRSFCREESPLKIYWGNWYNFPVPTNKKWAQEIRSNVIEHCRVANDWLIRYQNCNEAQWAVEECYPETGSVEDVNHRQDAQRMQDFIEDCNDLLEGRIWQNNIDKLDPFDCKNTNWR